MNLFCYLGIHEWDNCRCSRCNMIRDASHAWRGCICTCCSKVRDIEHDWSQDCQRCSICQTLRDVPHEWIGCKCASCGKTRDTEHDWAKDCQRCSVCNTFRAIQHEWVGSKCAKCGKKDRAHLPSEIEKALLHQISNDHPHTNLITGALSGNASPQYSVGIMFMKGENVEQNAHFGKMLLKSAADQGHLLAREYLQIHCAPIAEPRNPIEEAKNVMRQQTDSRAIWRAIESQNDAMRILFDIVLPEATIITEEMAIKAFHVIEMFAGSSGATPTFVQSLKEIEDATSKAVTAWIAKFGISYFEIQKTESHTQLRMISQVNSPSRVAGEWIWRTPSGYVCCR